MKKLTLILAFIAGTAKAQTKADSLYMQTKMAEFDKQAAEYDRKIADTAHYWVKRISQLNDGVYTTRLLPARDTVECYFETTIGEVELAGYVKTQWYLGVVTRWHEEITAFYHQKYRGHIASKVETIILNYKIK